MQWWFKEVRSTEGIKAQAKSKKQIPISDLILSLLYYCTYHLILLEFSKTLLHNVLRAFRL